MLKSLLSILAMVVSLHAGTAHAWWNIFGDDPREDVKAADGRYAYPFEALGRSSNGCTVALVGKRLGLTAAHCVVDAESGAVLKSLSTVEFNLVDGVAKTRAKVAAMWVGTFSPVQNRMKDWAILQFDAPVDSSLRRLKLRKHDFEDALFPYPVSLAGYNGDRKGGRHLSVVTECSIRERVQKKEGEKDVQEGLLLNDCASAAGISGAPLLVYDGDDAFIEAIAVSERRKGPTTVQKDEYTAEFANIAVPINAPADALAKLIKSVDAGLAAPKISGAFALKAGGTPSEPLPPPSPQTMPQSMEELDKLFEQTTAVGEDEMVGWWVGRCFPFNGAKTPHAAVLITFREGARWGFAPLFHVDGPAALWDELTASQEATLLGTLRSLYNNFTWPSLSSGTLTANYTASNQSVQWRVRRNGSGYMVRIHTLSGSVLPPGATNGMCYFDKKVRDYRSAL